MWFASLQRPNRAIKPSNVATAWSTVVFLAMMSQATTKTGLVTIYQGIMSTSPQTRIVKLLSTGHSTKAMAVVQPRG